MIGVDPDTARHFGRLAAGVRLKVGDDFATAGPARSLGTTTARSPPTFSGPGPLATAVLTFVSGRSVQVSKGPFELGLLFTERCNVFLDQSLGLFGLGHLVMVLSGGETEVDGQA